MVSESLSFNELVASRRDLQKFCSAHYASLMEFNDGISFKVSHSAPNKGSGVRHLSSTATCLESILDCPSELLPKQGGTVVELSRQFAIAAIHQPHKNWKSDGSASVYCRCRTLPLIIDHLQTYDDTLCEHLKTILSQLKRDEARLAIGEAWGSKSDEWYPSNAFHTYWTLNILQKLELRFQSEFHQICTKFGNTRFNVSRLRAEMLVWSHDCAGKQMALHATESSTMDSDQLAWSLATLVTFGEDFQASLAQQDFIRWGLKCLFERQTQVGTWRTGAPLFHYKKSGNAYCYVFETFAALLKSALTKRKESIFLRQVLRNHVESLLRLWRYAVSTQIPLFDNEVDRVGWSSGHRPSRKPESWATASVFSFAQCLRRIIGCWVREIAAQKLPKPSSIRIPSTVAIKELSERGDTWAKPGKNAASQLIALFVNPVKLFQSGNSLEPDSKPIGENQARGAILFGPPGTSKTTLVQRVADAIDWDYVELHASHFVSDGLPNVQRTADAIFEQLLQLDRTVILFDEIDELVRERDMEPDAFGRFLTTSMLPKLAELWKLRKVIYFVATNHITFFDRAVTRAQRFDALMLIAPPSLGRKIERVNSILKETHSFKNVEWQGFDKTQIDKTLDALEQGDVPKVADDNRDLPPISILAKLLLMRWDQLHELCSLIAKGKNPESKLIITRELLEEALSGIADPSLRQCRPFREYLSSQKYEQIDFGKSRVWRVEGPITGNQEGKFKKEQGHYWYISNADFGDFGNLVNCKELNPGTIHFPDTTNV